MNIRKREAFLIALFFLFLTFVFVNQTKIASEIHNKYTIPADFESQEMVWMSCIGLPPFNKINAELINIIESRIRINIVTDSDSLLEDCRKYLSNVEHNSHPIKYRSITDSDLWIRDHGAVFVKNKEGLLKIVDFNWTQYGYREWLNEYYSGNQSLVNEVMSVISKSRKGQFDSLMAVRLGIPIEKTWIAIEGGAIETNGKGTIILNEKLTLERNPGVARDEIEKEFKRVLGVSNIIWLQEGLAEDPHIFGTIVDNFIGIGTGGHTDEFVRFVGPKTILLAWVPEEEKHLNAITELNFQRMSANYEILKSSRNEHGEEFKIVKVPLPNNVMQRIRINKGNEWDSTLNIPEMMFKPTDGWSAGDSVIRVAATSYLNYFVTNSEVIIPSYIHSGTSKKKEQEVKNIFNAVFPGRRIISVNALPLNWRGGGLHCVTLNQPASIVKP
ncbi:MAG: agmatine deiminase family protein [Saprospiraceae bacterium]|nr:agmatine deiminase family protein [Candidatus Vicinibacter affinis]MBP6523035.1 agmatine deiminase family protein [Saprospiraceae bacterium]MBK6822676.1 agmatine deiminase family protein [Candidatus Vicinibacter affinis]MBK7695018.1 agmatine deiminase family protein [Candidatus Vicinibacter affinis]MBK7799831.1 agmatine deiminase family protein [Candidatus Vicinibacter affinis]